VVDILLRKLAHRLQDAGMARAFADDTAMVLRNLFASFSTVAQIFEEYSLISGLHLNFGKTIVVPLWREQEKSWYELRRWLVAFGRGWEDVKVANVAKYLGFLVGPGRNEEGWTKAIGKWQSRAKGWSHAAVGLQYAAMLYNTFCASTLYFLAQLEEVPKAILDDELRTTLHMAKGPTAWANSNDLWRMGQQCGVGRSFHCIAARASAAMFRACVFECWEKPLQEELLELNEAARSTEQHDRLVFWDSWYCRAFPRVLLNKRRQIEDDVISMRDIRLRWCPGVDPRAEEAKLRTKLQGLVAAANLQKSLSCWQSRVEWKITRWRIPGNRHRHGRKVVEHLAALGRLVAPRVAAAVWGLVWNRWCTARRFQTHTQCALGCGHGDDSIEHYVCCRVTRAVGRTFLRIQASTEDRCGKMMGWAGYHDEDERRCWAILTYGVYVATNSARRRPPHIQAEREQELSQHCRQASEGHGPTMRCILKRWAS